MNLSPGLPNVDSELIANIVINSTICSPSVCYATVKPIRATIPSAGSITCAQPTLHNRIDAQLRCVQGSLDLVQHPTQVEFKVN